MSSSMKDTVKLCRLCANITEETGTHNLFDKSNQIVIQQIKELTGLTIRDMPRQILPRYFCTKCKDELSRAWEFRRQIIKTQDYFKSNDYKNKLETSVEKDLKPTFMFVPMKEYEMNETLEANSDSADFNEIRRDGILTAAECVEPVIKEKKTVNRIKKANNITSKRKTTEKPENDFKKIRDENIDICKKSDTNKNDACSEDGIQTSVNCADNDISDDYHVDHVMKYESYSEVEESLDYNKDQGDADFVMKPKREHSLDSTEKTDPDLLKIKQFSCHLCQHPIKSLICLKIHFQKQHKREKFKCNLCDEKFTTIKSLVRHLRLHQGEKPYKCHFCDLSFMCATLRCRHERREHSKDSPFLCFICGKTFITSTLGKDHMAVHTKERAFHCVTCKASFLQRSHLRNHYRSVTHKNNEEKLKNEELNMKQQNHLNNF